MSRARSRAARRRAHAQEENYEKQETQKQIDDLLRQIVAIERQAVQAMKHRGIDASCPRIRDFVEHSRLVEDFVRLVITIHNSGWSVWPFFEKHQGDEDTRLVIATIVAAHLACMSTAHRRYKYAPA